MRYFLKFNFSKSFYTNFTGSIGKSDLHFEAKTGVKQSWFMSAILLTFFIDPLM